MRKFDDLIKFDNIFYDMPCDCWKKLQKHFHKS